MSKQSNYDKIRKEQEEKRAREYGFSNRREHDVARRDVLAQKRGFYNNNSYERVVRVLKNQVRNWVQENHSNYYPYLEQKSMSKFTLLGKLVNEAIMATMPSDGVAIDESVRIQQIQDLITANFDRVLKLVRVGEYDILPFSQWPTKPVAISHTDTAPLEVSQNNNTKTSSRKERLENSATRKGFSSRREQEQHLQDEQSHNNGFTDNYEYDRVSHNVKNWLIGRYKEIYPNLTMKINGYLTVAGYLVRSSIKATVPENRIVLSEEERTKQMKDWITANIDSVATMPLDKLQATLKKRKLENTDAPLQRSSKQTTSANHETPYQQWIESVLQTGSDNVVINNIEPHYYFTEPGTIASSVSNNLTYDEAPVLQATALYEGSNTYINPEGYVVWYNPSNPYTTGYQTATGNLTSIPTLNNPELVSEEKKNLYTYEELEQLLGISSEKPQAVNDETTPVQSSANSEVSGSWVERVTQPPFSTQGKRSFAATNNETPRFEPPSGSSEQQWTNRTQLRSSTPNKTWSTVL